MPTQPASYPPLPADETYGPLSPSMRGGISDPFAGVTVGPSDSPADQQPDPADDPQQFAGMGEILEEPDADVYRETNEMVLRQEMLALNHLAQDNHYGYVVGGYPWSTLTHDQNRDVYEQRLPYGVSATSIQAVPNKALDLVNKASEQILVDFPKADCEPIDDSEEADAAADMANRFLEQDATEHGTNDAVLFDDRVKLALSCASTYLEVWTDPVGGGYVPLQIEAHPQAVSPEQPLIGPDGMPSVDTVLRYVTADGQFTNDASQAAPQWQPKLRASKWQREHIRVFPEQLPVELADQVIILAHCTIGEMKKRSKLVAAMAPEDLSVLCDWTPTRYQVLLPAFQRARWKLSNGKDKNKGGSSDERIMFYYHRYIKASPDYPKGADVMVTGAHDGMVLDKKLLSKEVSVTKGSTTTTETRCREIPVVQITPRGDPRGQDPSGRAYVELFVGAAENSATLAQSFNEVLNDNIHTPFAVAGTSPITGEMVRNARATGDMLNIRGGKDDMPQQMQPPQLPNDFFAFYDKMDEAVNSIASQERAAQGADNSKERSGKALQIAVSQNSIGNTSMRTAVNNSYARFCRIKVEVVMSDYSTAQQIGYVGEDGAYKQEEFAGTDFALIGKVTIKSGTGTGLPPDQKVQYLGGLKAEGFITADDAVDAARPSYSRVLGIAPNPHEQYVERCVEAWTDGPPESDPSDIDPMTGQPKPDWATQYRAWQQAEQQYEALQGQFQQQTQMYAQGVELKAKAMAGPPQPLGPESQNAQAGDDYAKATIMLGSGQYPNAPPVAPQPPQVPKPWTPFTPRPNDTEPVIAGMWMRKLSRVMSTVEYTRFGPEWKDVLDRQYTTARQAVAMAGGPVAPGQQQPSNPPAGKQPTQPTRPTQPTHQTGAAA